MGCFVSLLATSLNTSANVAAVNVTIKQTYALNGLDDIPMLKTTLKRAKAIRFRA